jgi:predicted ABC-type ATPase
MAISYELSPEDNKKILTEIISDELSKSSRPPKPTAIFVGGQMAAGKSTITNTALKEFVEYGIVQIDADELRKRHPDYTQIMREGDKEAGSKTQPDASRWVTGLIEATVADKRNFIIDSSMRDADWDVKFALDLKEKGYQVDARILAVNKHISRQGIVARYENQKSLTGSGRLVPFWLHDDAYKGVLATVKALEEAKAVDRITIYDRGNNVLYENTLTNGEWAKEPLGD